MRACLDCRLPTWQVLCHVRSHGCWLAHRPEDLREEGQQNGEREPMGSQEQQTPACGPGEQGRAYYTTLQSLVSLQPQTAHRHLCRMEGRVSKRFAPTACAHCLGQGCGSLPAAKL